MKSTEDFPFKYFEFYFAKGIYDDAKKFYASFENASFGHRIKSIDRELHIVHFLKDTYSVNESEHSSISLEKQVHSKLDREIRVTIDFIELGFKNNYSSEMGIKDYARFLNIKLRQLESFNSLKDYPFLKTYTQEITETINRFSKQSKTYSFIPSFTLLAENEKAQKEKIERLYKLLIEPPSMISSSKEEFLNAFTGKEVVEGVNWLVTGKSKMVSKASLFYFLSSLEKSNYLNGNISLDLNKYVSYTFRDNRGMELKNLKQSKATVSNNPTQKDRIDNIISSL